MTQAEAGTTGSWLASCAGWCTTMPRLAIRGPPIVRAARLPGLGTVPAPVVPVSPAAGAALAPGTGDALALGTGDALALGAGDALALGTGDALANVATGTASAATAAPMAIAVAGQPPDCMPYLVLPCDLLGSSRIAG